MANLWQFAIFKDSDYFLQSFQNYAQPVYEVHGALLVRKFRNTKY